MESCSAGCDRLSAQVSITWDPCMLVIFHTRPRGGDAVGVRERKEARETRNQSGAENFQCAGNEMVSKQVVVSASVLKNAKWFFSFHSGLVGRSPLLANSARRSVVGMASQS